MGVGSRVFHCFLCDACGREVIAEEGQTIDGFYIEVVRVQNGGQVGCDNVYACSDMCIEQAIRDSIKRETLPEPQKVTATQELWLKGRQFNTPVGGIPIVDVSNETRRIGTAQEIASYKPSPQPRSSSLPDDWKLGETSQR
jgi:hypothetical protein